jgi:hypothetical protein
MTASPTSSAGVELGRVLPGLAQDEDVGGAEPRPPPLARAEGRGARLGGLEVDFIAWPPAAGAGAGPPASAGA